MEVALLYKLLVHCLQCLHCLIVYIASTAHTVFIVYTIQTTLHWSNSSMYAYR